jgi:hypothetical protein
MIRERRGSKVFRIGRHTFPPRASSAPN